MPGCPAAKVTPRTSPGRRIRLSSLPAGRVSRPCTEMVESVSEFRTVALMIVPAFTRMSGPGIIGEPFSSANAATSADGPLSASGRHAVILTSSRIRRVSFLSWPAGVRLSFAATTDRLAAEGAGLLHECPPAKIPTRTAAKGVRTLVIRLHPTTRYLLRAARRDRTTRSVHPETRLDSRCGWPGRGIRISGMGSRLSSG